MKNNKHKISTQYLGFSLIEVMIALILLGTGVMGIVSFQLYISRSSELSNQNMKALFHAESILEMLFICSQKKLEICTLRSGNNTVNEYSITWTVQPETIPNLYQVLALVTWQDRLEQLQMVEVKTRLFQIVK